MVSNEKNQSASASGQARTRPFTSREFLDSVRDDREIWIYGERVKDVTTHPAFRNTVRMMARLYDALHDQRKGVLCTETDTGNGGYTHKFFKASRNVEEMVGARDAIAEWARVTYGWMGRSPDYKAAFLATLVRTRTSILHFRRTRGAGTRKCRRKSRSSIMRLLILLWIATRNSPKCAMSTCTSKRKPTAA